MRTRWISILAVLTLAAGCKGSDSDNDGDSDADNDTPTITITSPADNATVTANDAAPDVPVSFTVEYFTLKDPGTCAAADAPCGHVHVLVDGTACNDTGLPYNNAGSASPIDAGLDYCTAGVAGAHTIVLELHNDDHSPVLAEDGTTTVSATVHITAQ